MPATYEPLVLLRELDESNGWAGGGHQLRALAELADQLTVVEAARRPEAGDSAIPIWPWVFNDLVTTRMTKDSSHVRPNGAVH